MGTIIILSTLAILGLSVSNKRKEAARVKTYASVTKLRPKLEVLASHLSVPVEFLMAWVQHESGGRLTVHPGIAKPPPDTKLGERGYFQIMPGKGQEGEILGMGTSSDDPRFVRLSTDSEYSLNQGERLVARYQAKAKAMLTKYGTTFYSDDFLMFVKLQHGGSGFADDLMKVTTALLGRPPRTWAEFYGVGAKVASEDVKRTASTRRLRFNPATTLRVLKNANGVGIHMAELRSATKKAGV